MKTLFPISFLLLLTLAPLQAEDSMRFSELGTGEPLKFALDKMTMEVSGDALAISAPAPWSCGWQYMRPLFKFDRAEGGKHLYVKAAGNVPGGTTLRVRLISEDWQRADVYEIPLTGLPSEEAADMEASGTMDAPVAQDGGGLQPDEGAAHLQILTTGKDRGPVELELHTIGTK